MFMASIKTAPVGIIAVKDVVKTSQLLVKLFGWKSMHGGYEFEILMDKKNVPMLMLHEFSAHEHQRFKGITNKTRGIGHSTYVFVKDFDEVYKKVCRRKMKIIEPLFTNENSEAREFTFQIEDGFQFTVCDLDKWLYYWV
jgi:hypothetical protein